jgi:hypothetical protein
MPMGGQDVPLNPDHRLDIHAINPNLCYSVACTDFQLLNSHHSLVQFSGRITGTYFANATGLNIFSCFTLTGQPTNNDPIQFKEKANVTPGYVNISW